MVQFRLMLQGQPSKTAISKFVSPVSSAHTIHHPPWSTTILHSTLKVEPSAGKVRELKSLIMNTSATWAMESVVINPARQLPTAQSPLMAHSPIKYCTAGILSILQ